MFADHRAAGAGAGEPLAVLLRPGNAGSNTATDHITVLREALRQPPGHQSGRRPGRKVLVRIDGAGATHQVLDWMTGQRLSHSVGYGLPENTEKLLALLPTGVWQVAYDSDGSIRDGAWVAEPDLTGWPTGRRVIARKERPHPRRAQLRLTDTDALRVTTFATDTAHGQRADLELRHRRRARCEDRTRSAKDTGLETLRCTTWTRTASGAPSSRWPASWSPGSRCSALPTIEPDAGNPHVYAYGCSPSQSA